MSAVPSPTNDVTIADRPKVADGQPLAVPGYESLRELGRGGMGVVYLARQTALGRGVALKMILAGDHAEEGERRRFLAEAEAVAAIRHPGIVQIHEFGTHEGRPYFAQEYCAGGSLAERLSGTPLPPREAARVVEQVARAVQALLLGTAGSTYFGLSAREQAKLAKQREDEATTKEQETRAALERVEETLAVGLLRPVGHRNEPLTAYELDALGELARLPREADRARVLFITRALEKPGTAAQLERQAEEAFTAAVGLRRDLRECVVQLATRQLRNETASPEARIAGACLLAAGRCPDPELARQSLGWILPKGAVNPHYRELDRRGRAGVQHARQLGTEAAAVGREILARVAMPHEASDRSLLGEVFVALAPKVPANDAAGLARLVVARARETQDPFAVLELGKAYAALAAKLPRDQVQKEAAELTRAVVDLVGKTANQVDGEAKLLQVFAGLAVELPAEKASLEAGRLARDLGTVAAGLIRESGFAVVEQGVVALAPKLSERDAADLARQVVKLGSSYSYAHELVHLARALVALAPKLPGEQAKPEAADLARRVVDLAAKAPRRVPVPAIRADVRRPRALPVRPTARARRDGVSRAGRRSHDEDE